jgi:threonine aldolase
MPAPQADFRSDTVTQPTPGMRAAMLAADVGDDVFGDDPSVNALQERIAALTGKEAALFMPSGTQSNLCGILAHCGRGDEYLVGQLAHTYRYEGGGAAAFGGVQPQPLAQDARGCMALSEIVSAIKPDDVHFARSRLLCLENTWNGHVLPDDYVQAATDIARKNGLATHLDGARLFNAAVATARPGQRVSERVGELAVPFDSLSVCFSKGLGAPVGSALCGSRALIDRARRLRKMAGGGMRQSGLLAACATYALEHHVDRLQLDHHHAQLLARGLAAVEGLRVRSAETNIVFVDVADSNGAALLDFLRVNGVLATGLIGLRFVTHLGVGPADVTRAIDAVQRFFTQGGGPGHAALQWTAEPRSDADCGHAPASSLGTTRHQKVSPY